jgi:hypothetical protein
VPGPRIALRASALDEQDVEVDAAPDHQGDRRLEPLTVADRRIVLVARVRGERFTEDPEAGIGREERVRHSGK